MTRKPFEFPGVFREKDMPKLKVPDGPRTQTDFFENMKGRSLVLTVSRSGRRTWSVMFYQDGKPRRKKLGYYGQEGHSDDAPVLDCREAYEAARAFDVAEYVKAEEAEAAKEREAIEAVSFHSVAERWFKRKVEGKMRTAAQVRRMLEVYIYPVWRDTPFLEIRRKQITELIDSIEDKGHARQADRVLGVIRAITHYYALTDEDYADPIIRGMQRGKKVERSRWLNDAEIVKLWNAAEGTLGGILKIALLTGQRRSKVATMRWEDVRDGIWYIAADDTLADREKGTGGALKLPQLALDVINAQPHLQGSPYVFSAVRGRKSMVWNCWAREKARLDTKLGIAHWTPHDLRRTSRTLMQKIGVADRVAEAVLGHAIEGVERVYARHEYDTEKADALEAIARYITGLLHPEPEKVDQSLPDRRKPKTRKAA